MTEPALYVLDDPAATVAEILAAQARDGGAIVLTGGSTPARAYELAAGLEPDWSRASVWWSDERCVPPGDERSNYRLVKRTLLDRLARKPEVHRIDGELPPEAAAVEYEAELIGAELNLVLLGLGADGHVASLFPGSPQLAERTRLVSSGLAGLEPFVDRVTLTLPTLLSAWRIVVLVTGAEKADTVARAFRGPVTDAVPASLLRTGDAPIDVYADRAAGSSIG